MTREIVIPKPIDFHCHFRFGWIMSIVAQYITRRFRGAVAITNLEKPIDTGPEAIAYGETVKLACGSGFEVIPAMMLTANTTPVIIREARQLGIRVLKGIPKGTSSNSGTSVMLRELTNYYPSLEAAEKTGMVFSYHWELLFDADDKEIPELEREARAIPFLENVVQTFPGLIIMIPHASTKEMIDFADCCPPNVFCELTVHHAHTTYDDVCDTTGKIINPHKYCKPIAKRLPDVLAVRKAMTSGKPRFGAGTDNAPWPAEDKEQKYPPPTGIFNPFALEMYCETFEECEALDRLPGFLTALEKAYGLPPSKETIRLVREEWVEPISCGGIVPYGAREKRYWKVAT